MEAEQAARVADAVEAVATAVAHHKMLWAGMAIGERRDSRHDDADRAVRDAKAGLLEALLRGDPTPTCPAGEQLPQLEYMRALPGDIAQRVLRHWMRGEPVSPIGPD